MLLNLEAWHRLYLDGSGVEVVGAEEWAAQTTGAA
jgi:hypothetical protein